MKNQAALYAVCCLFAHVSLAGIFDYTCSTIGVDDDTIENDISSIGKEISDGSFDIYHISQIGLHEIGSVG